MGLFDVPELSVKEFYCGEVSPQTNCISVAVGCLVRLINPAMQSTEKKLARLLLLPMEKSISGSNESSAICKDIGTIFSLFFTGLDPLDHVRIKCLGEEIWDMVKDFPQEVREGFFDALEKKFGPHKVFEYCANKCVI